MPPRRSVIIPAHQEEEQISETLDSLTSQTCDDFEVVVVANGCTDRTVKKAKEFSNRLNLKVVETRKRGMGYACNLGVRNSCGETILILEADTTLSTNALEEILKAMNQGYVGGTLHLRTKEKRKRYALLSLLHFLGRGGNRGPVRFCSRSVYHNVGGHRETFDFGVDNDFAEKIKKSGKTKFISNAFYYTSMRRYEKLGIGEMLKQSFAFIYRRIAGKYLQKEYPVVR